jgi:hypothetical protein
MSVTPSRYIDVFKKVVKDNNLDYDLSYDIMNHVYDELSSFLSVTEEPYVNVKKLGIFNVKLRRLDSNKGRLIKYKDSLIEKLGVGHSRISDLINRINRHDEIKANINKESQRKYNVRAAYYESLEKENK